jgi:hypothetical protein
MPDEPFHLPDDVAPELLLQLLPVLRVSKLALDEPENLALRATAAEQVGDVIAQIRARLGLIQPLTLHS